MEAKRSEHYVGRPARRAKTAPKKWKVGKDPSEPIIEEIAPCYWCGKLTRWARPGGWATYIQLSELVPVKILTHGHMRRRMIEDYRHRCAFLGGPK